MSNKQKKIFKFIIIFLSVILVAEIIYFGIRYYNNRQNSVFYTVANSALVDDNNNYIGAGFSDYRNSDFNDYNDGINKATVFINKNGKLTNEIKFGLGYNSYFHDIVKVNDGYVAVGFIQMTKDHMKDNLSEGLIVKFDNDFNVVWRKNISGIGKTELLKVKTSGNDIIAVGTSVYGEGYIGNHNTGGGILIKYDKNGKQKLKINNGGPYNGRFNDFLIEKDGYVVAGLGKANSGIIIKYSFSGKKIWSSSYGYTDKNGINSIVRVDNSYIAATTKVIDTKNLNNYSAALVKFSLNGKKLDDTKYNHSNINYFADIATIGDDIFVCGYTGKNKNNNLLSDAIIVKYDKDLFEEGNTILKGKNNEIYNNIYVKDGFLYALGYSNSKIDGFDLNGYDYFPIVKKYSFDLK